jgi:gluconokinase
MAAELGLSSSTPFVVGANDGVLSNLGVNAIGPGEVAVTIGTSGAMRTVVDHPVTDPSGRTFCYALTDRHWVIGGPVNNGGIVFRWVRDELTASAVETAKRLGIDPYEVLTRIAERVAPGAEGLLFHPYLAGERAPLWNANLRGSFFGLAMHHHKEHMIRAVLEGVIFNLYSILPAVEAMIGPTRTMKATGGFARSGLWRQMMADIFDREVVVPESSESSCLGAAVLGLYALGRIDSLEVIDGMVGATHRHEPIAANVAIYRRLLPIFLAIPTKLEEEYRAIAAFQRDMSIAGCATSAAPAPMSQEVMP